MNFCFINISRCFLISMLLGAWSATYNISLPHNGT
ncbi:Os03g0751800 [Oryza sativa Japonica Group]|uniref:Os03g0751800 protein n=1 Tax=Oryza sativa subsp. japonica TaxID=39947 RepID=A0A0P0W358_ORYSJ|nr:hypothetical protein EE612_020474 [Oryza sativa]BAS86419.1 Os03g0751800 [Oryza sativa Japonica Group]